MKHEVLLSGACGRMGRRVAELIAQAPDLHLAGAIERKGHPDAGGEISVGGHRVRLVGGFEDELPSAELLVDFTTAEGTAAALEFCLQRKMAFLSGTTGHTEEGIEAARRASKKIGVLISPNMSVGITLLAGILPGMIRSLGKGCDVELIEKHHRHKKDSPSGTALRLAREVSNALGHGSEIRYGRDAGAHKREAGEVFIHSVRAGDIIGEHTLVMALTGERIELKHVAESRDCFAHGTLAAVRFLLGKPAGWYTMEDVVSVPAE